MVHCSCVDVDRTQKYCHKCGCLNNRTVVNTVLGPNIKCYSSISNLYYVECGMIDDIFQDRGTLVFADDFPIFLGKDYAYVCIYIGDRVVCRGDDPKKVVKYKHDFELLIEQRDELRLQLIDSKILKEEDFVQAFGIYTDARLSY